MEVLVLLTCGLTVLCTSMFWLFSNYFGTSSKIDASFYNDPIMFVLEKDLQQLNASQLREVIRTIKPIIQAERKELKEIRKQSSEEQRVQQEITEQLRGTIANLTRQNATLHQQNTILSERIQGQMQLLQQFTKDDSTIVQCTECTDQSLPVASGLLGRRAQSMPQLAPLITSHDKSRKNRTKSPLRIKTALIDRTIKSPKVTTTAPRLLEQLWGLEERPESPCSTTTVRFNDIVQVKDDEEQSLRPIADLKVRVNRLERWIVKLDDEVRAKKEIKNENDALETICKEFEAIIKWKNFTNFMANDPLLEDARRRRKLCADMYTTETKYVNHLRIVVENFMQPLLCSTILMKEDVSEIFTTIQPILKIHTELLSLLAQEMIDGPGRARIGMVFVQICPFFKIYIEYLNKFDRASEAYERAIDEHERFKDFLQKTCDELGNSEVNLMMFLSQPLQHIPRYHLLLSELIKYTPEDHIDYWNLKQALDIISKLCASLTERRRQSENARVLGRLKTAYPEMIEQIVQPNNVLERAETGVAVIQAKQRFGVKTLCDRCNITVCLLQDVMLLVDERNEGDMGFFVVHFSFANITVTDNNLLKIECIFHGDILDIELTMDNDRELWHDYILNNFKQCKRNACKKIQMNERELDDLMQKELVLSRGYPKLLNEVWQISERKEEMEKSAEQARERLKITQEKMRDLQREIEKLRMEREDYVMELHHLTSVHSQLAKDLRCKQKEKNLYEEKIMQILNSKFYFEVLFTSVGSDSAEVAETPLSLY